MSIPVGLVMGKLFNGRTHNHAAKIKFLKTNWDISELFFDKWIAAIGQQGLIEDSSLPNLRANIIISEYAASTPSNTDAKTWVRKKVISLLRAFPKNRSQYNYSYNFDSAGTAKTTDVDFEFDAYRVYYEDVGVTKVGQSPVRTPGYVTASTAVGTSIVGSTVTPEQIKVAIYNSK